MKLCHLHLQDPFGNLSTLICFLDEGNIKYSLYSGINSSGSSQSLSNLQCNLPLEQTHSNESQEQFVNRIINTINTKSVRTVIHQVKKVSFPGLVEELP